MKMYLRELSDADLRRRAPSVFAERPIDGVSDQYAFVNTAGVIDACRAQGFRPFYVRESGTVRGSTHRGFQKHEVRLTTPEWISDLYMCQPIPYVALTNSHDRSCRLAADAGLFRLVCSNGMMAPDVLAYSFKARHIGDLSEIVEGISEVAGSAARLIEHIDEYKDVKLAPTDERYFAEKAIKLYGSKMRINPEQILMRHRDADLPRDLWTTLNVVQENLVKGRFVAWTSTGSLRAAPSITDIQRDQNLNRGLFLLAEEMKNTVH